MEVTNRRLNHQFCFGIIAMLLFLTCQGLSPAGEPTSKPTMNCVPSRPIAHPGETITVRAWINGSPAIKDIKWEQPSVGKVEGTTLAKWTFPKEDTSVSIEAPVKLKAFARHESLGKTECELRVYFVRAPVNTRGPVILSGRNFLVHGEKEPEGYGLYTFILFRASPRDDTERERYLKVLESYLLLVRPIEEIEYYRKNKRNELNITLLPVLKKVPPISENNLTEAEQVHALAKELLKIYDYARAQVILAGFDASKKTSGPYFASKRATGKGTDILLQDTSHVFASSPNLMRDWLETFLMLATQETSWTDQTLQKLRLNVLNFVAVTAGTTPRIVDAWIRVITS